MVEEQKKTEEGFQSFCGGMPCGDMMRKMLEAKKSGQPFNCAEMMSQMMQKSMEERALAGPVRECPPHVG